MSIRNMSPMERVEYLLEQQKQLQAETKQKEEIVVKEEPKQEVILPELSTSISNLSLIHKEERTKENLIAKFSADPNDYSDIVLTQQEMVKIKKVTGRAGSGVAASVPIICRGDLCSVKEKCLDGDTNILVDGLSTKKIKDIVIGDKVYSITDNTMLEKKLVTNISSTLGKVLYTIKTETGRIISTTKKHPFLVKEDNTKTWLTLEDGLNIGDTIYLVEELDTDGYVDLETEGDCILDTIQSITYNKIDTVYDITVKDNENYVANSFVVHNCPYYQMGKAPVGRECLLEVMLAEYWTERYIEDLGIDLNSISEVHYLSRLVEISILEERLGKYISINQPEMMMDVITAVDDEGNEITNKASSISFEQKERLDKSKMKILESLSSTRKERLKVKQEEKVINNSNNLIGLNERLAELQKSFENSTNMKIVN